MPESITEPSEIGKTGKKLADVGRGMDGGDIDAQYTDGYFLNFMKMRAFRFVK